MTRCIRAAILAEGLLMFTESLGRLSYPFGNIFQAGYFLWNLLSSGQDYLKFILKLLPWAKAINYFQEGQGSRRLLLWSGPAQIFSEAMKKKTWVHPLLQHAFRVNQVSVYASSSGFLLLLNGCTLSINCEH